MKRISKITGLCLLVALICSVTLFSACSNGLAVVEVPDEVGWRLFNMDSAKDDVNVIFFDDDNVVSKDGTSYTRNTITSSQHSIKSSDCYMIKSGDCEILVDAGQQMPQVHEIKIREIDSRLVNEYLKKDVQTNLLRKIATVMSDDGVLDYLIVTHADYDHIAALIVEGGVFDAFLESKTIVDFNNRSVKFKRINNIIDFDSGLVRNYSDEKIEKNKRLITSGVYQAYVTQRDALIKQSKDNGYETKYCPAAALFEDVKPNKVDEAFMPDNVIKKLKKSTDNNPAADKGFYILDESTQSANGLSDKARLNASFDKDKLLASAKGKLVKAKGGKSRYYYSLAFNNGELRILYNWHYNYIYHGSFGNESAQNANNISVCFEVVKDKFKFLSLGDLGGNGENALLKYYGKTDVLKNVSLYKPSHHGSINNDENSSNLFKKIKPRIIAITGCAQVKPVALDIVTNVMLSTTKVDKRFFDNVDDVYGKNKPYVLCTNINTYTFDSNYHSNYHFYSLPFYGDIKVRFDGRKMYLSYSYAGQVKGYVKQDVDQRAFTTRDGENKFLSVYQTKWFKQIKKHIWES